MLTTFLILAALCVAAALLLPVAGTGTYVPVTDATQVLQASTTKTADFNGAWLDLGEGFEPGGLGYPCAAVVDVTAADRADGDETYRFHLEQTGPDANGVADDAAAEAVGVAAAVPVSGTSATPGVVVAKGLVTKRFVRLALDVSGTTPSVTYSALLGR